MRLFGNSIRLNQDPSRQLAQVLRLYQDRISAFDAVWPVVPHDSQSVLVRHNAEAVLAVKIAASTFIGRCQYYRCSINWTVIAIRNANSNRHFSVTADDILNSVTLYNLKSQTYRGLRHSTLRDAHETQKSGNKSIEEGLEISAHAVFLREGRAPASLLPSRPYWTAKNVSQEFWIRKSLTDGFRQPARDDLYNFPT